MKENNLIRAQRPFEKRTLLISLLKAMFLVLIAITVFEYAKHLIFPRLTVFYSHIIGIIFGVMFIGATGYRVQKRQEQLSMEKIAETEKRMRSEASLLDVAEKYHKLFIDSMDGVCQTTLDGKIVEANQAFCDILGCDTEGIIGESITQFYDNPEDRVKFRNVIEKNNGVKNYEIIQRRKDGQQIICSISSSCYYAENEVLSGYLSIVRDITEHKRAEEALKEREEKYRSLFNNAEVGMFRTRLDGSEILDMNEKFLQIFSRTREEMQCNPSMIHWADPQEREEMVRRLKAEMRVSDFECRMLNKRGAVRNCLTSLKAFPEQGILEGSIIDVTERKRAEEALRESEERFSHILKTSLEGIWILNEERRTTFVNKRIADMLGYAPEEIIGKRVDAFMFEEDLEDYALRGKARRRGVAEVFERRFRRKDGTTIWNIVSTSPLFDCQGRFTGSFAMFTDITERKQAAEALKESDAKYYDLYDNAPDMYYSLYLASGTIKECNETFVRVTGYSKEELIGRPIFELYDEGSADDAKQSFQQFPVTGEVHDAERRVKCKDGRIIHISLNVSAIRDKDGNITHSRSIWRDITKRKEQEELIRALSITDQLTGLYNRRGFMTLAEQQLRVAERTKNGLFLLYADLDGLKQINDKLGHKSGDEAIVEAANVLKEVFRKMDIIARMGGDEFAVLAPEASLEYADMIKHRLQDQLDIHNSKVGRDYKLSLSIGMVYHDPSIPSSLDELISRADSLMYEQKWRKKSLEA